MSDKKTIIKKIGGYCVVQNEVSQALRKNTAELGLYTFLLSLPNDWEFKKTWLKEETGIGINKLNRMLAFLESHHLIKTIQRKIKGKFAEFEMEIYDGKNFKIKKLKPLFNSPSHRFRDTETVATEIEHNKVKTKKVNINKQRTAPPVDKSKPAKKKQKKTSDCVYTPYSEDFFPNDANLELLQHHATRTNNPTHYLLDKFKEVQIKYKTKTDDWQKKFAEFLINEKPKRTYEDSKGGRKRYDGKSIHY